MQLLNVWYSKCWLWWMVIFPTPFWCDNPHLLHFMICFVKMLKGLSMWDMHLPPTHILFWWIWSVLPELLGHIFILNLSGWQRDKFSNCQKIFQISNALRLYLIFPITRILLSLEFVPTFHRLHLHFSACAESLTDISDCPDMFFRVPHWLNVNMSISPLYGGVPVANWD